MAKQVAAPQVLRFPTETEITIDADGRVTIADLPAELMALLAQLGTVQPCEILPAAGGTDVPAPGCSDTRSCR